MERDLNNFEETVNCLGDFELNESNGNFSIGKHVKDWKLMHQPIRRKVLDSVFIC